MWVGVRMRCVYGCDHVYCTQTKVTDLRFNVATQTRSQKATTRVSWRRTVQRARSQRLTELQSCRPTSPSSRHAPGTTGQPTDRAFRAAGGRRSWLLRDDRDAAATRMPTAKPRRVATTSKTSMKVRSTG